ncbi:hypothetical protein CHU92_03845 [Flavobacterium cyanobacteriorum]|uniref:Metal-dependent hydrolase n=1 Tax=Flavobacterium cyanobacteriorum TaxID=2022802 RepID=A0A255ZMV2_9FLAO|nr:DUF6122 family protein [Flavobacterium cyanobacteriorum]OYQ42751.1 hypothetical protein CHU92_03845 [Flavobacterium cyanobacteriorum]
MAAEYLKILQTVTHYSLHFMAPGLLAWLFFRDKWKKAWLVMIATMLVDLDHLLATPIFEPGRCSIGFHPLHSYPAIAVYVLLLLFPKARIVATGLLFHMATDFQDCLWTHYINTL